MEITVAVDCMGGDHGPPVTVPAAAKLAQRIPGCRILLVGLEPDVAAQLRRIHGDVSRLSIVHASEVVEMDESPALALRSKKNSSMRVAVDLVQSGAADACVSAGNTGALMAISRFVLKTLPGIERPAIASALPTLQGHTYVLDLGANVDCTPSQLLQFGLMGSSLVSAVDHVKRPRVGLLNIGEEDIKGNDTVKQAGELFKASDLNYIGNVEGDDIYLGGVDVVVCDGFVGNVALKTSEGLAQMIATLLRQEFSRGLYSRLAALIALPVLRAFKNKVDHRRYNGASLLGLRGIVVKSHGSADSFAFQWAIERAAEEVRNDVLERIGARLSSEREVA